MNFCTVESMQAVLQIGEDKWDSKLAEWVTSASPLVDVFLARGGLTVPVSVPQIIVDATKYLAAWDFRRRRDPVGAEEFWNTAIYSYRCGGVGFEPPP